MNSMFGYLHGTIVKINNVGLSPHIEVRTGNGMVCGVFDPQGLVTTHHETSAGNLFRLENCPVALVNGVLVYHIDPNNRARVVVSFPHSNATLDYIVRVHKKKADGRKKKRCP